MPASAPPLPTPSTPSWTSSIPTLAALRAVLSSHITSLLATDPEDLFTLTVTVVTALVLVALTFRALRWRPRVSLAAAAVWGAWFGLAVRRGGDGGAVCMCVCVCGVCVCVGWGPSTHFTPLLSPPHTSP